MDSLGQANLYFSKELQCFRSGHGFCETVGSESNRPRVLREQKMLPEVRNRRLLLRDLLIFSIFEIDFFAKEIISDQINSMESNEINRSINEMK